MPKPLAATESDSLELRNYNSASTSALLNATLVHQLRLNDMEAYLQSLGQTMTQSRSSLPLPRFSIPTQSDEMMPTTASEDLECL